ncbi:sensor histidine kinase [Paenibacillus prosopidis]|nr:sensor histidine kinase [Paenibacillus prosopidis]
MMITSYVWPLPYFNLQDYPAVKGIYMFLMHGLVMGVQIWRYRYAKEEQKRHIRWFIWGMGCYFIAGLTAGFPIFVSNGILRMLTQIFLYTGLLFIPFSIGMMALDRLQKRSVVFNRTLVYIVLSTMSIMAYALLVGVLGTLMQGKMNAIVTLMATGLIAVLFHPLRERVQRAVNHLVYGERDDPYRMLSGLTERLEGALTHRSLLPAIVETTANALRIPYAAIESVDKTGEIRRLAEYGIRDGETVSEVPLAVQGETVGRLVLGIHRVSEALPPNKRRMLDDLIRQVSIAVQAVRLTDELRRSRERLVSAREEERRRLRRDLHDGLGSGLASMMLRLDEVMTICEREPERTKQTLLTVQSQMREAVADIRRLVYALRPPALDEFGLAFAVKELAHQMEEGSMRVVHEGFDRRLKLNAAAEVAIYRIVQEALTNAVKHSGASLCKISLLPGEGGLHLEVADNGRGLPGAKRNGIGIGSMHERAEELGGSCSLSSVPGKGVRLNVFIPIDQEDINDVSKPIREGIDSHLAR